MYSRLLLHEQDEMRRLERLLNAMDKTDEFQGHGEYLMSPELDATRESIPSTWLGESRPLLMEKLRKKALDYGNSIVILMIRD